MRLEELVADYVDNEEDKEDIILRDNDIISEADLKLFFKCRYSYFLKKFWGFNKLPKSGAMLQAIFFRNAKRGLFNVRTKDHRIFKVQRRAGPNSMHIEQMTTDELIETFPYKSAESFGKAMMARWNSFISLMEKEKGEPIVWAFSGEKGVLGFKLMKACTNYYNFVLEEGVPKTGFMDSQRTFSYEGLTYRITLPEIRFYRIDDVNLHEFKEDVEKGIKITLRMLGFSQLVKNSAMLRYMWGIKEETVERMIKDGNILLPDLHYRHFNLVDGSNLVTKRNDSEVITTFKKAIEIFLTKVSRQEFPINLQACPTCPYNSLDINYGNVCNRKKPGIKSAGTREMYLKRSLEVVVEPEKDNIIPIRAYLKKHLQRQNMDIKKEVAVLNLYLNRGADRIDVASIYNSNAYGFEYELKVLDNADKELNEVAKREKKPVNNTIDFQRYFKFVGQRKIERKLLELGYARKDERYFTKEYKSV